MASLVYGDISMKSSTPQR